MKYNEPWKLDIDEGQTLGIIDSKGNYILLYESEPEPEDVEKAKRIVACVNFCQGMSNESLAKIEEISLMCTNEERLKQIVDAIDNFNKS